METTLLTLAILASVTFILTFVISFTVLSIWNIGCAVYRALVQLYAYIQNLGILLTKLGRTNK
jgi:hypothetical protein